MVLDRLRIVLQRRGANGLVGLLRLCSFLDTIYVRLFGENVGTIFRADILSHLGDGVVADADRIGAHVGDQADVPERAQLFAFVELLRDLHGPLHGVLEAVVRRALQRGGDERRRGRLALFFARHRLDDVAARLEHGLDDAGLLLVRDVGFLAVYFRELGDELRRVSRSEFRGERPVLLGDERFDRFLAVDDHLHRHRLHPAGGESAANFVPEQR